MSHVLTKGCVQFLTVAIFYLNVACLVCGTHLFLSFFPESFQKCWLFKCLLVFCVFLWFKTRIHLVLGRTNVCGGCHWEVLVARLRGLRWHGRNFLVCSYLGILGSVGPGASYCLYSPYSMVLRSCLKN